MTMTPDEPLGTVEQAVLDEAAQVLDDQVVPDQAASMDVLDSPRRMLLVHAHPDDETIGNGASMATYAAAGVHVTLVTCTRGEEGEVLVPDLAHLAADRDDDLGAHRVGELATAMEALGVRDHRFLGGAGRWRDSGMMGEPSNATPRCFWMADLDEAAAALVEVLREVRPQVVLTYDPDGGYGHPDHIQAHRVTMRAIELAADASYGPGEPWQVLKVYWNAVPASVLREGLRRLRAAGDEQAFGGLDPDGELPSFAIADELVTTSVDGRGQLEAKLAALRAYPTQVAAEGPFFAMASGDGELSWGVEHYRLVAGELGATGPDGRESDLFSGID